MQRSVLFLLLAILLVPTIATAQQDIDDEDTVFYEFIAPQSDLISVEICDTENIASGITFVSSNGNDVIGIDESCNVTHLLSMFGPIGTYTATGLRDGYGIINGIPTIFEDGEIVFEGRQVRRNLNGHFHHEFVETAWGTYMGLVEENNGEGMRDDVLVEFDENNNILKLISINILMYGEKWGAECVGIWCENWLHTNAIDTITPNRVIISPRNESVLMEIDWDTLQVIDKEIGKGFLALPHHVTYMDDGNSVLVYDNNVVDGLPNPRSNIDIISLVDGSVQTYQLPFFAPAYGSIQKLDNGNWLTVDGPDGVIYEFNSDFTELYMKVTYEQRNWLRWRNEYSNAIYRASKVPHDS